MLSYHEGGGVRGVRGVRARARWGCQGEGQNGEGWSRRVITRREPSKLFKKSALKHASIKTIFRFISELYATLSEGKNDNNNKIA